MLSVADNRSLVDAGSLVGTFEFKQLIFINALSVISADGNVIRVYEFDSSRMFRQLYNAGILGRFMLHSGSYNRSLGHQQRHGLPLHVGSHQRPVGVVVFKEGDHRGSNGYYLLWRYVHIIDHFPREQIDLTAHASGGYLHIHKVAFRIQRFIGLSNDFILFVISGQVMNFICYPSCGFIYNPVRSLNKSIFIDHSIGGERSDQPDIRAFRRLDRTHSSIMRMVDVTYFESGSFSGKTTRSQSGQSSFMG